MVRLMGTGPRDWNCNKDYKNMREKFEKFEQRLHEYYMHILQEDDELTIISGGAQGFDIALAKAASNLEIPFELWFPNPGYINYYYKGAGYNPAYLGMPETIDNLTEKAQTIHYSAKSIYVITETGRKIHSNFLRNTDMLNHSNAAVVGLNKLSKVSSPGTKHAINQLKNSTHVVYNQKFQEQ